MRRILGLSAPLLCIASALAVGSAGAQPAPGPQPSVRVVTVCGRDDAAGGLNLANALSRGGDVVIRCGPGPQAIEVTRTHAIRGAIVLDGEGRTTLTGTGAGALFAPLRGLTLRRLTVAHPRPGAPSVGGAPIAVGRQARIVLEGVRTERASAAYQAASFVATDSVFEQNGDPAATESPSAVVDAEQITLVRSTFRQNFDHPVAGGAAPEAGHESGSRQVTITDSTFTENRQSLLLLDAEVSIRGGRFAANGVRPPAGSLAFGCCGGAITLVHSRARIAGTEFVANQSAGFGGAIYALGSDLTLSNVGFETNAARAGGAVAYWGWPARTNIWSSTSPSGSPRLIVSRTRFRNNAADGPGGGLLWAGAAEMDSAVFRENRAGTGGGAIAHWRATTLAPPFQDIAGATEALSAQAEDRLSASRAILVDNRSGTGAAALAGGPGRVSLGNSLVARNHLASGAVGAALTGARLELANVSVVDNQAPGLSSGPGGVARLINVILADNAGGNCGPAPAAFSGASSLQHPGATCGAAVPSGDPGLTDDYEPAPSGAAAGAGDTTTCLTDPLVGGVDLRARPRLQDGRCSIGALEREPSRPLLAGLPFGLGDPDRATCLFALLAFLLLVAVLLGFWCVWRRRRRRRRDGPKQQGS